MKITVRHRKKSDWMGRFGGGWNWSLGFQAGGSTVILNLLTFSVRFDFVNHKDYGMEP